MVLTISFFLFVEVNIFFPLKNGNKNKCGFWRLNSKASRSSEDIAEASVLRAHKAALWEAAVASSELEARPSAGCCSPRLVVPAAGSLPLAVKEPWLQIQKLANADAGTHCKDNWKNRCAPTIITHDMHPRNEV